MASNFAARNQKLQKTVAFSRIAPRSPAYESEATTCVRCVTDGLVQSLEKNAYSYRDSNLRRGSQIQI